MKKKIIIFSIIFIILDLVSKVLITNLININTSITIIPNFFYLTNVHNYGAAWSILENKTIFLIITSLLALAFIYREIKHFKNKKINIIMFSFMIGGIIGNLIDRVFLGYVRDFISLNIFGYHFPVFNIADSLVVISAFILIMQMFKKGDNYDYNK